MEASELDIVLAAVVPFRRDLVEFLSSDIEIYVDQDQTETPIICVESKQLGSNQRISCNDIRFVTQTTASIATAVLDSDFFYEVDYVWPPCAQHGGEPTHPLMIGHDTRNAYWMCTRSNSRECVVGRLRQYLDAE